MGGGAKIANTAGVTFYDHNLLDLTVDTKALLWTNQIVLMAATCKEKLFWNYTKIQFWYIEYIVRPHCIT